MDNFKELENLSNEWKGLPRSTDKERKSAEEFYSG